MDVENFEFKLPKAPAQGPDGPAEEQAPEAPEAPGLVPAGFNERLVALAVDVAPFVLGAWLLFPLMLKRAGLEYSFAAETVWKWAWVAAFVLYSAVFSSGGRATPGKRLLGLQVIHADGENYLSPAGAFVRSAGYLLSSLLLMAGFLLALVTKDRRALHDLVSQSRVISVRERGDLANGLVLALSWAIMVITAASWARPLYLASSPEEQEQIKAAQTTLNKFATLEEIHKTMYGGYTDDVRRLAFLTRNVEAVRREVARTLERDTLAIASDGRFYIITAKARDRRKTAVGRRSAPPPR